MIFRRFYGRFMAHLYGIFMEIFFKKHTLKEVETYFTICLENIVTTAVDVFPLFTIYNFVKSLWLLSFYVRDLSFLH